MKRLILSVCVAACTTALAGCPAVPSPTATTSGTTIATTQQKTAVASWAAACQTYDQAKIVGLQNIEQGKIPTGKYPLIRSLIAQGDPLCSALPTNPTTVATTLLSIAAQLQGAMQ